MTRRKNETQARETGSNFEKYNTQCITVKGIRRGRDMIVVKTSQSFTS